MYAELHCKTNYSFLSAASHADELVQRAIELGYTALAITDENTLAGVVKGWKAARHSSLKLIVGAELLFNDAPPLVVWATDRKGYGNLCKLLTIGRRRAPKGHCWLEFSDLAELNQGLLAGLLPELDGQRDPLSHIKPQHPSHVWFSQGQSSPRRTDPLAWKEVFDRRLWLLAELYLGSDDARQIAELKSLSTHTGIPLVAAGDVLYHSPDRMPLHNVLTAIRHQTAVAGAGQLLPPNAWRHLHSVDDLSKQFACIPEALEATQTIADQCVFRLDELRYEYPRELAPDGMTPFEYLQKLTWQGAKNRWPNGIGEKLQKQIEHELGLVKELNFEAYFLTVWDIVRFARSRDILCQGRGSAANSAVCYALGVTSVDPTSTDLLFERFISRERNEAPDIDIDFEHERREEVLQYLYEKYGRHRAGLAATVITYRTRGAIRDVGKALGLSLDRVDAIAKQSDAHHPAAERMAKVDPFDEKAVRKGRFKSLKARCRAAGIDPDSRIGRQFCFLVEEIRGFPRHLSQHVGGMILTDGNLDELVPIENAAMDDRTVIQWDKDDLEELGLLKVDCLCLGMLTAIRKCFELIQKHDDRGLTLANIPQGDEATYDMICKADTVGVFQIESRGQMSMLPRLKPRCWYDLVIEVAIVRPGPIQGNMVHPYLRRRNGEEPITYPNDEIRAVLDRTLGVPLFQEQAMKLAIVAAGFTPGQADQLRRAMGTWRSTGLIEKFRTQLMEGMQARGLTGEFAEAVFRQIRGFGEYGFPESHAASFALLVYVSAWLKRHYPAAFTASILNAQPMGFYAPAQLVGDAVRHGVTVLAPDVNFSDWGSTLEDLGETKPSAGDRHALRLGLRQISGLPESAGKAIEQERLSGGMFQSVSEFSRRTGLLRGVVKRLSDADAFRSVHEERRTALWQALGQEKSSKQRPLLAGLDESDDEIAHLLPRARPVESVASDYRAIGLSLRGHPMEFYREWLRELKAITACEMQTAADGSHVQIAGIVTLRQRPSTAKGITFVTLEDETGMANLVVKPHVWERYRQTCHLASAWLAEGKLENRSGVIHLVAMRVEDLSERIEGSQIVRPRDFR